MHLHENNLFAIFPWPRFVVAQYPLHHVTCAVTKYKAAAADSLGEDTITWNRTHEHTRTRMNRTDGQTQMDHLWYEINVPFFLQEKVGIKCLFNEYIYNI